MTALARHPDIERALAAGAVISYSVSGGKDSDALVLACERELRGHPGPRLLIHSDLGVVEWADSLPQCQRLADRVGLELVTVRRRAGGMLERWQQRWRDNVARYAALETVTLILPWSTASMRFCTSELKTAIICRELRRRYPGQVILNALGIRGEESPGRAQAPVCKPQSLLTSTRDGTSGYTWLPIHHWTLDQVWAIHRDAHFAPHIAYTAHGMSRVSCIACILASKADLSIAVQVPGHEALYRAMVDLEIASTFAFQDSGWLGDVAPGLLSDAQRDGLARAKRAAVQRQAAERRIPKHLLYDGKGWPKVMPTYAEAQLLAEVRCEVAAAVGLAIDYTTADAVMGRYEELMAQRPAQDAGGVLVQGGLW
jgi:3'-phosphoadenosine 5'-phosphosulfate sulfotransferase (PAPS reductase)/FAD synthetase